MDQKIQSRLDKTPNYKRIYEDIISKKYPDKFNACQSFFNKDSFSVIDILKINQMLFSSKNEMANDFDQKHKSYDKNSILEILDYQAKNKLNNSQLAKHFQLSRNTVSKWKKIFL